MTVSSVVRELAEAIISTKDDSSARHRLQLELFRLMPLYSEIRILGHWDRSFTGTQPKEDDTSETGRLIGALYEFAICNFYGAFQADAQMRDYQSLCQRFRGAGIACPPVGKFVAI